MTAKHNFKTQLRNDFTRSQGKKNGGNGNHNNDDGGDDDNNNEDAENDEHTKHDSIGSESFQRKTSLLQPTSWPIPLRQILNTKDTCLTSSTVFAAVPSNLGSFLLRSVAIATITLYVLNQKHMLPMPIGKVVSKALFWPTIPITITRRIGRWSTVVDSTVVMGGAPFGWCGYPERLVRQFNVRGVINMCDEYLGPISSYRKLGIEQLHLPTVDHFEPSVEYLKTAVSFIQKHERLGGRVYVHCRAGHGRSAAAVYAWLLYKEPLADPIELNEKLCSMRDVRKSLWKQPNINIFRDWLQEGGMMSDSDSTSSSDENDDDDYLKYNRHEKYSNHNPNSNCRISNRRRNGSVSDNTVSFTKIGKVFDDEDTEDMSDDGNDDVYSDTDYDMNNSEDDEDYALWKRYDQG